MANIIIECKCGKKLDGLSTNLTHEPHTDITIVVDPCNDCLTEEYLKGEEQGEKNVS